METHRYSIFLGCVIPNRLPQIEAATRLVVPKLGIELVEMEGASCCPAPGVIKSFDLDTWLAITARNIALSEENGLDILVLCNGCYGTLIAGYAELQDPETRKRVNKILKGTGHQVKGTATAKHLVEVLYNEIGKETIEETVVNPIDARFAIHVGCHLLKPADIRPWGIVEDFTLVDELVEMVGGTTIDYKLKDMCCGAGGGLRSAELEVSLDMVREKLQAMQDVKVDALVNVCNFCHLQFDLGQMQVNKEFGTDFQIPVLYYTQLLGLAQGFTPKQMGLDKHYISTDS
ncbi:MAG: CoB--CoM heterodisulfide reductase subunit B, partial [Candidatus Hermodarchaeota archaeon]|nr:CoB--CoM heterodisulfide reductase subunit B [Candidatus Hermodarchaeota archaeon]